MNSCVNNIVAAGICANEAPSVSGFTLMQAAGMSPKNLDDIANENYKQGVALAEAKKQLAVNIFRNDLIGALQANRVIASTADVLYNTSTFKPTVNMGVYAGERGITLHQNTTYRGRLRRTKLSAIQVYPLAAGTGTIKIYDGYTETPYPNLQFVANQVNTFAIDYTMTGSAIRVVVDNTEIPFASAPITCMQGCNKTMPNPCGWADGWTGTGAIKGEGYGINVQFYCHCDYDQLICDMAKSFSGELLWLKWTYLVYEEQWKTNRFNSWVTYNRDEIKRDILPGLEGQYVKKWNAMMDGLPGTLATYKDDCLNCRGIKWQNNL